MLIAFWIVVPIVMYLFVAGITSNKFQQAVINRCDNCSLNGNGEWKHTHISRYGDKTFMHSSVAHDAAPWLSVAWPIVLPFMIGQFFSELDSYKVAKTKRKQIATEQRRANELAEQRHQVELAKLRARENELLDQHLKLEEIRGRHQDR